MANRAKRHVHKYHFTEVAFGKIWACGLPDCNHYMPQHMTNMVNGKYSICWRCEAQFILDAIAMKSERPICVDCLMDSNENRTNSSEHQTTDPRIANLLKEIN